MRGKEGDAMRYDWSSMTSELPCAWRLRRIVDDVELTYP